MLLLKPKIEKGLSLEHTYIAVVGITNCYVISSIWLNWFLLHMSYRTLGVLDCSIFLIGWLSEIPSGIAADKWGRRNCSLVGFIGVAIGCLVMAGGASWISISLGNALYTIGYSFISGALEAYLYDSLKERGEENEFVSITGKAETAGLISGVIAAVGGPILYTIDPRLPFITQAALVAVGCILILQLPCDRSMLSKSYSNESLSFIQMIKDYTLTPYFIFSCFVLGTYYAYFWGFPRPALAEWIGLSTIQLGITQAIANVIAAFLTANLKSLVSILKPLRGMIILSLGMSLTLLVCIVGPTKYLAFSMIIITIIGSLLTPWIQVAVHPLIESHKRATLISSIWAVAKIPYVLIALIGGELLYQNSYGLFFFGLGCFSLMGLFAVMQIKHRVTESR